MPIIVCGINHKTAPVALREKVVFAPEKLSLYLQDLLTNEGIAEAILLSTCNRSELYCDSHHPAKNHDWFCRQHQVSRKELEPALYFYENLQAVEHIMGVACGLDSMVLGESQILGQMKEAFSESCAAGAVGALFNRLFQHVFAVAKEIRTNTAIGACPVSVSSAAVKFIQHVFPNSLTDANILLIGAGLSVELALRHLIPHSPKKIFICNRSMDHAKSLQEKYGCQLIPFSELANSLTDMDVAISSTGATLPVVTRAMLQNRKKPIFIVDIAVPRDVEMSAAECVPGESFFD